MHSTQLKKQNIRLVCVYVCKCCELEFAYEEFPMEELRQGLSSAHDTAFR